MIPRGKKPSLLSNVLHGEQGDDAAYWADLVRFSEIHEVDIQKLLDIPFVEENAEVSPWTPSASSLVVPGNNGAKGQSVRIEKTWLKQGGSARFVDVALLRDFSKWERAADSRSIGQPSKSIVYIESNPRKKWVKPKVERFRAGFVRPALLSAK